MKKYLLFFLFGFALLACEDSLEIKQQKIQDAQWEAMIANHDVVMPMMGNTHKVRKDLKNFIEQNENLSSEIISRSGILIQNLRQADDGMMTWMNKNASGKLKKLRKEMDHAAILKYIEAEDAAIKQVGKNMTNNIKAGKDFLASVQSKQE